MEDNLLKAVAKKLGKTLDQMIESFDHSMETDKLNKKKSKATAIINTILSNNNITDKIEVEDIEFDSYSLTNSHYTVLTGETRDQNGDWATKDVDFHRTKRLSEVIFNAYYPRPQGDKFLHYTKLSSLRGILQGKLKLNSLMKNYNDDEFRSFYKDHNIYGYQKNIDENGQPLEDSIMSQSYALCFAMPQGLSPESDSALWRSFADNGHGVKIVFTIKTTHPDFRSVFYRDKYQNVQDLLFNQIDDAIQANFRRRFSVSGISKIGAFYLPGDYNIESEARFLIKKYTDDYTFSLEEHNGFIYLPFMSQYATITIASITPGQKCPLDELESIISEAGYNYKDIVK